MRRRVVVRAKGPVPISRRIDGRILVVGIAGLVVTTVILVYATTLGSFPLTLGEVWKSFTGRGSEELEFVVFELQLPRLLTAVGVGAALGLSGALFQSFARNPLVSPDIIGVNTGASLVAVGMIVAVGAESLVPAGAFTGAIVAAAIVYSCSRVKGLSPYRLVLIGIGVDAVCRAGVSYFLIEGDINDTSRATVWMIGSLYTADGGSATLIFVALLILVPAAFALRRSLENLQVGEDTARALGTRVNMARSGVLLVAVLLAASAVSICGPVAFVAFLAPHLARRIARAPGPAVFTTSMVVGVLLVLVSDLIAQYAFPVAIPLGVITPVVGGPYFLYLLLQVNRRSEVM